MKVDTMNANVWRAGQKAKLGGLDMGKDFGQSYVARPLTNWKQIFFWFILSSFCIDFFTWSPLVIVLILLSISQNALKELKTNLLIQSIALITNRDLNLTSMSYVVRTSLINDAMWTNNHKDFIQLTITCSIFLPIGQAHHPKARFRGIRWCQVSTTSLHAFRVCPVANGWLRPIS